MWPRSSFLLAHPTDPGTVLDARRAVSRLETATAAGSFIVEAVSFLGSSIRKAKGVAREERSRNTTANRKATEFLMSAGFKDP